ncbi:hypothetical protein CCP3SC5AM1_960008 [Gammaproteobacteria bacterium]
MVDGPQKFTCLRSMIKNHLIFSLSCVQNHDASEGRKLLEQLNTENLDGVPVIMDRAYEDDKTRKLMSDLGMEPVVPPKFKMDRSYAVEFITL